MSESAEIRKLGAEFDAALEAIKRKRNPTRGDVDQFIIDLTNVVGGLLAFVTHHVERPFTKAHDKGRDE